MSRKIVGPRCLLNCYAEGEQIPRTTYPVYNMAMNKLVICTAKFSRYKRKETEKLVGYMGGDFTGPLTTRTTHVIVSSTLSGRYFIACEKGMQIMKSDWVEDVWNLSNKKSVKATDYDIVKKYSCPIFYNLQITCSSLSPEKRAVLADKINKNGGTYASDLIKNVTNILILPSGLTEGSSSKFSHAVKWKIPCIEPVWIDLCIKKGHTIPYEKYIVMDAIKLTSAKR